MRKFAVPYQDNAKKAAQKKRDYATDADNKCPVGRALDAQVCPAVNNASNLILRDIVEGLV